MDFKGIHQITIQIPIPVGIPIPIPTHSTNQTPPYCMVHVTENLQKLFLV
ncbi:hypothetical protein HanRHA438_Chr16g0737061 [Helianthus annuus]|nr:hypothetical protein HanRHA438_Chr16g0737061 [Helianthus annuus]